jgi:hypothetical protein
MNLLPSLRSLSSSTLCAALVACAGTEPAAPTVARTPPPQDYEKTISNYFAFKIRGPQKNAQLNVAQPEPGSCALDGYLNSIRGWVVPVVYETRTGEPTGRETITITAKPYYFWFLGNTIAGVTPRQEQCPGVGSAFDEPAPPSAVPGALQTVSFPSSSAAEPPQRERLETTAAAKPDPAQKRAKAKKKKKTAKSSGTAPKVQ